MRGLLLLLFFVLIAGCTQGGIDTVFNNLPQVQQFISEHPDAKVVANYWTSAEVAEVINSISSTCEKNMTVQDMYSVRVSEGTFEVNAWFDKNYNPLCIVKAETTSGLIPDNASPVVEVNDDEVEYELDSNSLLLDSEVADNCVKLTWTPYPNSDLKYYKVVSSGVNSNPKYPVDGYISVITSRLDNSFIDCNVNAGVNYYGVTMVATDGSMFYTNPVSVTVNQAETVLAGTSVTLDGEVSNDCVSLSWDYEGVLKYYKVVRSVSNPEPKYPDDGYISVISDFDNKAYLDCDYNKSVTNYYRITVVLPDDNKIHSNVLVV